MEIMYLLDTNIILEVLLSQQKKETCKNFLNLFFGNLYLSDFSLHSIGVILFRENKSKLYQMFVNDFVNNLFRHTIEKKGLFIYFTEDCTIDNNIK